jgi:Fe-S cluster assembly protein SufD
MKNNITIINNSSKQFNYQVKDGEKKVFLLLLIDGASGENEITISLEGKNSYVLILGIIFGYGKQSIHIKTIQDHKKPYTNSDLLIKSILFDKASFHYEGLIQIQKNAHNSSAKLINRNLLLSPQAHVITKPYLEIQANEVSCSHGVATGNIDQKQSYYLQTRGLDKNHTTHLLTLGFLSDILTKIPDDTIREKIQSQIEEKLQTLLIK